MRAISVNNPTPAVERHGVGVSGSLCARHRRPPDAFTLLEIMIALTLVAILISASLPYMLDSFASSEGERAAESIAAKAMEARGRAMESGEVQRLELTPGGISGAQLPSGWTLEVRGLNDARFHSPAVGESWEFNAAGICEPLQFRIGNETRRIVLTFDALTAQPLPEHD